MVASCQFRRGLRIARPPVVADGLGASSALAPEGAYPVSARFYNFSMILA